MSEELPLVPTDREIFEGKIATYWFDGNILVSRSKSVMRTVALIHDNMEFVQQITGNRKVPLLVYLAKSPVPDKATREYSSEVVGEMYSAMALVAPSSLSSFIMRLIFGFQQPPIPMKSFSDAAKAKEWLLNPEK